MNYHDAVTCLDCPHPGARHSSTHDGSTGRAWCNDCGCTGFAFTRTVDGKRCKDGEPRPPIDNSGS